jgi:hypothetical protein
MAPSASIAAEAAMEPCHRRRGVLALRAFVMPGLDPGIHRLHKKLDCRVKPGNDEKRCT